VTPQKVDTIIALASAAMGLGFFTALPIIQREMRRRYCGVQLIVNRAMVGTGIWLCVLSYVFACVDSDAPWRHTPYYTWRDVVLAPAYLAFWGWFHWQRQPSTPRRAK